MTVGYPDDQAYPNVVGPSIADVPAFSLSAATPFSASGYITNFGSARVRCKIPSAGNGAVATVTYYADASLADQLGSYSWTFGQGAELSAIVPNLGNFVVIGVTTTIGPAFNCQIQLTPLTVAVHRVEYPVTGNEAVVTNHSIGAGNTFVVSMPFVVEGNAHVFVYPHDASGKVNAEVDELHQDGTVAHKIVGHDGALPTAEWDLDFQATNGILQLALTNTDTVGHTVDACLVVTGR